jgi:prepilin-type N-terminal cleavage/methylation domain-containing protein
MQRKGFTLLELLIVIAILAVLAIVAVLVINPLEYIKQSRDGKRIADFVALNKAIQIYDFNSGASSTATLASTTIYLSLPDNASTTCGSYTLPVLPIGYKYNCVSSTNLQKVDSTGWIPLNLSAIPGGSPLTVLPIDPNNNVTQRTYYSFVGGGSFELAASMESTRFRAGGDRDAVTKDGGALLGLYEVGTSYSLIPVDYGDASLVGYWNFDEGAGTASYDKSGANHVASFYTGSPAWTTGKVGNAVNFNGSSGMMALSAGVGDFSKGHTLMGWFNPSILAANTNIFLSFGLPYISTHNGTIATHSTLVSSLQKTTNGSTALSANNWYHITGTFDGATVKVYVNGVLDGSGNYPGIDGVSGNLCIGAHACNSYWTTGKVDEVKLFNRALSASEILAIYSATK